MHHLIPKVRRIAAHTTIATILTIDAISVYVFAMLKVKSKSYAINKTTNDVVDRLMVNLAS